jgi:hypothetical protein
MIDLNYAKKHYSELGSAQLRALLTRNTLIAEAAHLVRAELGARGEHFPEPEDAGTQEEIAAQEALSPDHYVTLTRFLEPTDAHLLAACLQANDIPAFVADANTVQTNMLLSGALGGVRLQVPGSFLQAARAIKAAYDRGDFALDESDSPES